jgi:hypothetical protein
VVLDSQLEIGQGNGDEGRDNHQNHKHNAQDAVYGVHLHSTMNMLLSIAWSLRQP